MPTCVECGSEIDRGNYCSLHRHDPESILGNTLNEEVGRASVVGEVVESYVNERTEIREIGDANGHLKGE